MFSRLFRKNRPTEDRLLLGLILWFAATFCAAALGAAFRPGPWYASLIKPAWTPPARVFGPVWTVLYLMMATAAWLVWKRGEFKVQRGPLLLFAAQLVANALWSPLCFGLKSLAISSLDILLLLTLLALTTRAFFKVSSIAGWLLVPCLAWTGYAATLNFGLWILNRPH